MTDLLADSIGFARISPAENLEDVWRNFDPTLIVDPDSPQYVPRSDPALNKLAFQLKKSINPVRAFLCGHRGSGKTTELYRLCRDAEIQEKFFPIVVTIREFGGEAVHLTHDAVLVSMGRKMVASGKIDPKLGKELDDWGKNIVKTFLKDEKALAEAGAKAGAWIAFFKAQLATRNEWKYEEKQKLVPKVQDLIFLLNRMATDLKNKTGKEVLVVVDDLEKGESEAHKSMHNRIFQENYDVLVQPNFSIIYTLPVYFRALPGKRIPQDELFAFSAVRLYSMESRSALIPPLDKESAGVRIMNGFIEKRIHQTDEVFDSTDVVDEILRIGGGLFRETARCIQESAYLAITGGRSKITMEDVKQTFDQVKKEYQPMIRGDAIALFREVQRTGRWMPGVEPYLQSRALVEYENGDLWIDIRYVLKSYINQIKE